jgi:hypothetical protein
MTEEPQIRNVIATPVDKTNFGWVCQPADYVTPDRICDVCKKCRLKPFNAECPNCHASILWDMS